MTCTKGVCREYDSDETIELPSDRRATNEIINNEGIELVSPMAQLGLIVIQ